MEGKNTGLPFLGGLDGYCKWSNPPSFLCVSNYVLSVTVWLKILLHINVKIWVTEKEFKNVGK